MHRRTFLGALAGIGAATPHTPRATAAAQQSLQTASIRPLRAKTFFGVPSGEVDTLKGGVAVVGVPYDLGHGSNPGTRLGPRAIREATLDLVPLLEGSQNPWYYDLDRDRRFLEDTRVVDVGDIAAPPAQIEPTLDRITSVVEAIVDRGATPVVLGGDHSITFPVLRGYGKTGRKLHVIHLDAHSDFTAARDPSGRLSYRHGNHLRHAIDLAWISGITMIGLRGIVGARGTAAIQEARKRGVQIVSMSNAIRIGVEKVAASIPAADSYYVTIDIDVLDPSLAPGTGTPVPGGFTYYQLRDLLSAIAARGRVVGFDLTEVSPPNDFENTTARLASHLVMEFLGEVCRATA